MPNRLDEAECVYLQDRITDLINKVRAWKNTMYDEESENRSDGVIYKAWLGKLEKILGEFE